MARKKLTYTVTTEGRDKGKVFVLTEMPASQAEAWAARALFALMNAGVEIPENLADAGLAGLAMLGIHALAKLPYEAAKPLLDEMFQCVQIQPNPSNSNIVRKLVEDDIEEVATRLLLRKEILMLHVDFFTAGSGSTSASATPPTLG